jgi:PAS domain S-box-containing protein
MANISSPASLISNIIGYHICILREWFLVTPLVITQVQQQIVRIAVPNPLKRVSDLKTKSFIITLMVTLVLTITALAQTSDPPAPELLILTDDQGEYPLGLHMEILEDPTGKLTIQDVSSAAYADRFVLSESVSPNFGFTNSAYWVRFRLHNESQSTHNWPLEVNFANMQYVDLYLPEGGAYTSRQTGLLRPFNTRDIANHHIVFNLHLAPEEEQTFYMRFQSGASMTLPLTLWSPAAFLQDSGAELFILGMFYGVFLIMLVYNLFLLYSLREASYLYFVCFLASGLLLIVSYDGVADQYLWPDLPTLNRYSVPLLFIFFMTSMIMFTDAFLEAKTRNRTLHWLIKFVLVGWGMLFLLVPFTSYRFILSLIVPFGVLTFGMLGFAGILSWRRGYRPARYFLFSWMGVIIGGIIILAVRLELIPSTAFTEQFFRLGIIWLVAFWSIALADRINLLKAEKEKANLEVQAGEARYRELVETMSDGLGVIDESGRFTYANDRLAEMLGYQADEIKGLLVTELADEENQQLLTEQLAKRKTGVTTPYELTWRRKDSSDVFTIVSPMPIFGAEGQYQGAFAIITDITERVKASRLLEQRVSERTRELSTLLEISHEITGSQGLDDILYRILERLKSIVEYRSAAILVFEEAYWSIRASWPDGLEKTGELLLSTEERAVLAQAFEPGTPVLLNPAAEDAAQTNVFQPLVIQLSLVFHADDCSWLGIPLLGKDRLIGLFILARAGQDGFADDQIKVAAAFANQAAIVIENHQLFDQVQATAAAGERNRLAQDLHDSVTQTLFTASVLAEATPRMWDKDQRIARQNMEKLSVLIRGALAEMRSMLLELRSGKLHNQTLGQLLTTLAEAARVRTSAAISLSMTGDQALPEHVTLAYYRIAQEALNNAIHHAEAAQINISLLEEPDRVELCIQDDGRGFDLRSIPAGHLGINIMSERAAQIGGDLRVQSEPGQGTEIIVAWSNMED